MKKGTNLLEGSIWKGIVSFAIPLFLGNLFQQLYNTADSLIVGNFLGSDALAAVSSSGSLIFLMVGFFNGIAVGAGVVISKYFGAADYDGLKKAVHTNIAFGLVSGCILTAVGMILAPQILVLMGTPESVLPNSIVYFRVYFAGSVAFVMYNIVMGILQAVGDSRHPLYYLIFSSIVNIVLDLLFVAVFGWGIAGAAIATIIAQLFSAIYCFAILKQIKLVQLAKSDFEHEAKLDLNLLKLGIPVVFQNIIIGVGGLVVQYVINGYGFLFVAGFTATNKLYGLLEMAAISYGYAIVTYVGQNLGAKQFDRIKSGVRVSLLISLATSIVISVAMFLFGKPILSLFLSGEQQQIEAVLEIAFHYLSIMASCLCILYFLYVYRSALQGLGNTMIPMLSGVVEFFVRVGVALLLPKLIGQNGIFYAEIAAWTGAAVLLMISYYINIRKFA